MKKFLLVLCLFITSGVMVGVSGDTVINVSSLPSTGLGYLLDKGWKFHTGDDPAFARADYDDHSWRSINPAMAMRPLFPEDARRGMGWMRVHFKIAPSLRQKVLLQAMTFEAVEIYLDGKLIARRGTINPNLKTGRGYFNQDPIALALANDSAHVLAIRYAWQANIRYINGYISGGPFFSAFFTDTQLLINTSATFENYHVLLGMCTCILLMLALLHIIFLNYNPDKKANLYFAGYAFFSAIFILILFSFSYRQAYNDIAVYSLILYEIALIMAQLCIIKAIYILFHFKKGRFYFWLIIVSAAVMLVYLFVDYPAYLVDVALLVTIAVQFCLALKAVYLKKRGAWIIAAGFMGGLAGLIARLYLNIYVSINAPGYFVFLTIAIGIAILCPAFAISLFLFREFALDGRLLQLKLEQVEQLSAQTLAQEQEKQEILASQNVQLEKQVTERTAELNQSLTHLRSTQTQLIQSEKMASLGELTAGIAHEIQNPLNFVNNFSEVSVELVDEMQLELKNGDKDEAVAISEDIKKNLEKIRHHGKRADAIVKGMLEHSRASTGQKELTDISKLANEYLQLAYHGLRAKDKSFNAEMITHFDPELPKIKVIGQDIGRVLLNLFNNAFYAVHQKAKTAGPDYKPAVEVNTSVAAGEVVISVRDNGMGIPDAIKDKIMQPFFTTKPTGEGTGLGLSLTYDMVVKGHGGSIAVDTKEGEFTQFIVNIPFD